MGSRRKKVIVTKCVARTVFPLRTVERRPWSIFYPLKKHKTGRFSPIRSRNQFFHKRDPYPNGKCLLFCQNNVWVRWIRRGLQTDMPVLVLAQNGTFYAFYAPRVQ